MNNNTELHIEESIFEERATSGDYLELPLSAKPFIVVGVLFVCCVTAFVFRVGALSLVRGAEYDARSFANIHRAVLVPAPRGTILDSRGIVLAEEEPTWSVVLDFGEIFRNDLVDDVADALQSALGVSASDVRAILERANPERQSSMLLIRDITLSQVIALKSNPIPGVEIEEGFRRVYPDNKAFSAVLGYVAPLPNEKGMFGTLGIEEQYEFVLRGKDGRRYTLTDARGEKLGERVHEPGEAGHTLQLTLDAELQSYMYERMLQGLQELGRTSGAGLAIDPQTGKVLALVSIPSFNNELFSSFGSNEEKQNVLRSNDLPFFNRPVSGVYSPGSAVKPFMGLLALKEGIVTPQTQIFSAGYIEIPNPYFPGHPSRFLDWKPHGWVDIRSALAKSSNIYFYEVGGGFAGRKGIGIQRMSDYWKMFLFHEPTGIDIPGEKIGMLSNPDEKLARTGSPWTLGDTYNVSIGQGDLTMTPIRLLSFIASIANRGTLYEPYIVERIVDTKGNVISERGPIVAFDYSSWSAELREIHEGMKDAVRKDYGTAHLLSNIPMAIAAKTGTAQINFNARINAFFVGYAPADDPTIAILILVENAREGSVNTLGIARDIFSWYYEHRIRQ